MHFSSLYSGKSVKQNASDEQRFAQNVYVEMLKSPVGELSFTFFLF